MLKSILISSLLWAFMAQADVEASPVKWFERGTKGDPHIVMHFFWSKKCPHCLDSLPYIKQLDQETNWLTVNSYQLVGNTEHIKRYQSMAKALGGDARSVPAFLFCNTMAIGFDERSTPESLKTSLKDCHDYLKAHGNLDGYTEAKTLKSQDNIEIKLPLLGDVSSASDSLPFITIAIAGIDAFNPCAFFVLMFMLSMMLHTGSRGRMLLVGGVFTFFSGFLYFLFMTAWLNLFRLIGQLDVITVIAALIAIVVGVINTKDFFRFKEGVSLTLSDSARSKLYQRVREIMQASSIYTLLVATVGLAFFANLYEFLCTAGLPMVYTRILTLNDLTDSQYYLYLAFYNVIYVIPLFVIVMVISFTLGGKKIQEKEGRGLKLISGMMMLMLGGVLLVKPDVLNDLTATIGLMLLAIGSAVIMIVIDNRRNQT